MTLRTLDGLDVAGKRVLLRADLNVPVREGKVADRTRIERLLPTIRELVEKHAKVIVCSHFGRPKGRRVPEMSLEPLSRALGEALGRRVRFAEDCIGLPAQQSVERMQRGDVLVLENTRFHRGEEANDAAFAKELAKLAELYVDDAFSAAHRAHASTEGVAHLLPAYAGRLMQAELAALGAALSDPVRPLGAIVGGAKISTKLDLLGNLLNKVDLLVIGGAMANTFLAAQGFGVGKSLYEPAMLEGARAILARAGQSGAEVALPLDVVVAHALEPNPPTTTAAVRVPNSQANWEPVAGVPEDALILDVGPQTVADLVARIGRLKTLIWNGPLGAFETPPFERATVALAKAVAEATEAGRLLSVAGGGDTVSALGQAGVLDALSYVSTAGGAFLEWMEGKALPGVAALG
ncbi:MAG: phosphoglycerate kinase [Alphaproteobacteria bacterium]|nr:phosphoglycerate kinase [Alphaproteobacteria bacterium]